MWILKEGVVAFITVRSRNGEGNGTPLQYSCLENPMDGGAWWAAVHGVAQSRARLSDFTFTFHFHALEEDMATHSSVLAWRTPGTAGPGGLPPASLATFSACAWSSAASPGWSPTASCATSTAFSAPACRYGAPASRRLPRSTS